MYVVETGLTLLAQKSLPLKFCPEAFATTVYLINRMPSRKLKNKSPIELLYNTLPDYMSLRVFGCLCFPLLRPYNRHKLDFRSSPCTFLGYISNQKGYKCLTNEGRIIVSRHVVFNENIFPFVSKDIKTSCKVYNPKISIPPILVCTKVLEEQTSQSPYDTHEENSETSSHDNNITGNYEESTPSYNNLPEPEMKPEESNHATPPTTRNNATTYSKKQHSKQSTGSLYDH